MKEIISTNGILLIINGKYAWEKITEKGTGRKLYRIILGQPQICGGNGEHCLEILYGEDEKNLVIQQYMSLYSHNIDERQSFYLKWDFNNIEVILDSLIEGHNLILMPLYNSNSYEDSRSDSKS